MMNCFTKKPSIKNNNNNQENCRKNPFRVRRNYLTMLEQNHSVPSTVNIGSKRLKQNDIKSAEQLIKNTKPKIPEKILKEMELYHYQRSAYNSKIKTCPCDD